MTAAVRNLLVPLGAVWGLVLAVLPALVMTDPDALTGFLVVALACAAVSGVAGTLVGGLLLGPLFGPLVERAINKEKRFVR